MLSSRYLHLHEALELGPMWLKRGAHVLPAAQEEAKAAAQGENRRAAAPSARLSAQASAVPPAAAHVFQTASAVPPPESAAAGGVADALPPAAPRRASAAAANARAATMAAVGSSIGGYYKTQERAALRYSPQPRAEPAASAPAPLSAEEHKAALAGSVARARVMAVSVCPAPEDLAAGRVFGGEDGVLLGKMFAAIGLAEDEVRRTSWLQTVEFKPSAAQVEADAARMQAECGLCGAQAVVLLGRFAQEPQFAAAIGRAFAGLPVFKIPHPASILRRPQLRAEAWEELKRLRDFLQAV